MEYKEALKRGLYDFEIARNWYRGVSSPENGGQGMHHDLVFQYIRNSALLIAPFTPHYSEHVYQNIVGEKGSIQSAPFPRASAPPDPAVIAKLEYMRGVVDSLRSAEAQMARKKGKGKAATYDASKPKAARIYVASEFPAYQTKCVELVKRVYNEESKTVDDAALKKEMMESGLVKEKKAMPFVQTFKVSFVAIDRPWDAYWSAKSTGRRSVSLQPRTRILRARRSVPTQAIHPSFAQIRDARSAQRQGCARKGRSGGTRRSCGKGEGRVCGAWISIYTILERGGLSGDHSDGLGVGDSVYFMHTYSNWRTHLESTICSEAKSNQRCTACSSRPNDLVAMMQWCMMLQ